MLFSLCLHSSLGFPLDFSADALSPTSLSLSWRPPPAQSRHGEIRSYTIRLETVPTREVSLLTTSDLQITIESLHPFYEYTVSVAATTVGLGPYTSEISITMPESRNTLLTGISVLE